MSEEFAVKAETQEGNVFTLRRGFRIADHILQAVNRD
jgi:hypothetical protein